MNIRKITPFWVFVLFLGYISGCHKNIPIEVKEQQISERLKEAQPSGSSLQSLISYLDTNKIEHGEYNRTNHTVGAIFRNVARSLFVITDLQITFQFDKKDKLLTFTSKEVYTGP